MPASPLTVACPAAEGIRSRPARRHAGRTDPRTVPDRPAARRPHHRTVRRKDEEKRHESHRFDQPVRGAARPGPRPTAGPRPGGVLPGRYPDLRGGRPGRPVLGDPHRFGHPGHPRAREPGRARGDPQPRRPARLLLAVPALHLAPGRRGPERRARPPVRRHYGAGAVPRRPGVRRSPGPPGRADHRAPHAERPHAAAGPVRPARRQPRPLTPEGGTPR
ncbi:hypothetical protein SBRY_100216 [Actinacidiphila bryophytorum]|uniref:Uncharacterized protein n=1 Tax=Actinacidiphila bryophytorum TaxID=1436133 RepID=A0A9W4GXW7_9ACTN|nr:hypothetical protein SBRY_100216 [Actinacidiphila bryophytorum]